MKSRPSHLAVAVLTAAVLQTSAGANAQLMNAPEHSGSFPAIKKPVEVNLADPGTAVYWEDSRVDAFVRLEELYPADPGQLSGAILRIGLSDPSADLSAEIGNILQPDGSRGIHSLGYLSPEDLKDFVRGVHRGGPFMMSMRELCPHLRPDAFSGAELIFCGWHQPQIRLCFGTHCLGVLRDGGLLEVFLHCARNRCAGRIAA